MATDPVTMIKLRGYGPELFEVESKVPEKGEPTPKQKEYASKLGFMEYYDENKEFKQFPDKGKAWLKGILKEAIEMKCREDPAIVLKYGCPNYREFLRFYSLKTFLNPDWLRKRAQPNTSSENASLKKRKTPGEGTSGEGTSGEGTSEEGMPSFNGSLTVTITIPRASLVAKKTRPVSTSTSSPSTSDSSTSNPLQSIRNQFNETHQRKLRELYGLLGVGSNVQQLISTHAQFNTTFRTKMARLKELLA